MTEIRIEPASDERFTDVEHALTGGGDGASCWCQWWMLRNKDFDATTAIEKRELLRTDLRAPIPSALLAYVGDEAVGWVKVASRPAQPRLEATRDIRQSPEPIDDASVWAITCFVVRKEHRGEGIADALLAAAVAHARANGARVIEGYPVDTSVKTTSPNALFHGALSSFLGAGFTEVARPKPARPIVSLTLA
ncbi:GNAT family N-acetyltransferase [Microbacterium sp. bgisy203]|uniref:GNAT family N-acetyltransferase n=1 Tax=Microbacterium sp. bgisy203 TaxID=3413799 RepID=UPI003D72C0DF